MTGIDIDSKYAYICSSYNDHASIIYARFTLKPIFWINACSFLGNRDLLPAMFGCQIRCDRLWYIRITQKTGSAVALLPMRAGEDLKGRYIFNSVAHIYHWNIYWKKNIKNVRHFALVTSAPAAKANVMAPKQIKP